MTYARELIDTKTALNKLCEWVSFQTAADHCGVETLVNVSRQAGLETEIHSILISRCATRVPNQMTNDRNITNSYILLPPGAAAPSRLRTSKIKKAGAIAGRIHRPEGPAICIEALQKSGPTTMPAV